MIRIKLAEDDRVKLSLPEWIEYDLDRPRLSEIRKLHEAVGWGWGKLLDQVNDEDMDAKHAARAVLWWIAVNRHNPISWKEFDLDIFGVEFEVIPDPNLPAPSGASTGSKRTSRRSRTSSA